MSNNLVDLHDCIKIVKLRQEMKLVDDLDFFNFPQNNLEIRIIDKTEEQLKEQRRKQIKIFNKMGKSLLKFVILLKLGKIHYP